MKVKAQVSEGLETTRTVVKNFERLIEASALLVVAVYAIYQAYTNEHGALYYVLIVSGVIIGLRGAVEFLKHLARKD